MPRAPLAVPLSEALGLVPFGLALRQMRRTFRGDGFVPKSRFDHTSLRMLRPRLALETWLGHTRDDGLVPLFNLVNRSPTPVSEGWSVRKTHVSDFRGRTGREALTYDSHNGTDFVVPPGTPIVAAAPGLVRGLRREFHRGGLKLYVDHGGGLVTTYNHLSRALVTVGQQVSRGEPIALSGAAGIDSTLMFPWVAPHLHFNVWLGGVAVDPFAAPGEVSLFRSHNRPVPSPGPDEGDLAAREGTALDQPGLERVLAGCRDRDFVDEARRIDDPAQRAFHVLVETITYPTRFDEPEAGRHLYAAPCERRPALDLPFGPPFVGVCFPDDGRPDTRSR